MSGAFAAQNPEAAAIARRRALADRLMTQATQQDFRHPLSIGATVAQSLAGALTGYRADQDETARADRERSDSQAFLGRLTGLLGGAEGAPAASPAPMAPAPTGGAPRMAGGGPAVAPADLLPHIEEASRETGIPRDLLVAQLRQESNFDPNARGRAGEIGLAQIMPATARQPGFGVAPVDPASLTDPRTNILTGARYLAGRGRHLGVTDWNDPAQQDRALAAYNGGGDPNYVQNVRRWLPGGGAPAATPVSAQAPGPPPQAAPQPGNAAAMRALMLEAATSQNPRIAALAPVIGQMTQRDTSVRTAPPGSAIINAQGQVIGQVPAAPQQPSESERARARYIELVGRNDRLTDAERVELEAVARATFGSDNVQVGPNGIAFLPAARPGMQPTQGGGTLPAQNGAPGAGLAQPVNDAVAGAAPSPTQRPPQAVNLPNGRTAQYMPAEQPPAQPPQTMAAAMLENANGLNQARLALERANARPQSFGFWRGVQNSVPGVNVIDRMDPEGVETRALAANLGSMRIHDRSGAAVTAAEFPRLRPFIPSVGDPPEVVQSKLREFVREYEAVLRDMNQAFGSASGYRELAPVTQALGGAAPAQTQGPGGQGVDPPPRVIQFDAQGRRMR